MPRKVTGTVEVAIEPDVTRLVRLAVHELDRAGAGEAVDAIEARLVGADGWLAARPGVDGGGVAAKVVMGLSPYAELALLEAVAVARSTGSPETKVARVRSALALAGW